MKNTPEKHYEVVVIGGGITGVGVLRDLALHGIKTLCIDKGDFSSQTSQSSSKMLHGGIRYLENFDFSLVHEALFEKNLWIKLAPELCLETPFCLPVFKESKYPLWMMRAGFEIYDFLSGYQNSPYKIMSSKQTKKLFPQLKTQGLRGSGIYYDAIVDDAKLALDCLYDALCESCVQALNYHSLLNHKEENDRVNLTIKDELTGEIHQVSCDHVIYATGPFTDKLLPQVGITHWKDQLLPSKGIHIWLKRESLKLEHSLVLQTGDGRIIFVIPQGEAILVGTTESEVKEEIFNIDASENEVIYLLKALKSYFPDSDVSEKDILSTYAGVRPLVKEGGQSDSHSTSRTHKIFMPTKRSFVIIGGKYTTFRVMAEDVVKLLFNKIGKPHDDSLTIRPLRAKSVIPFLFEGNISHQQIQQILKNEKVRTLDDLFKRRLGVRGPKHWRQDQDLKSFLHPLKATLQNSLDTQGSEFSPFLTNDRPDQQ